MGLEVDVKRCNDEVIAVIKVSHSKAKIRRPKSYPDKFLGIDSYLAHQSRYQRPVLIVTESPHIEEFNVRNLRDFYSNTIVEARPVNGVTGMNILLHLAGLLEDANVFPCDGYYPVIVMNALQEQCSQGDRDTGKYRTRNFIRLWGSQKVYLEHRLEQIEPLIVLCSCTVGDFNLSNGMNAYYEGNRTLFEQRFEMLLKEELQLMPSTDHKSYSFLGCKDLSGLVLGVLDSVFATKNIPIYKTTHPSSWRNRTPALRKYNNQIRFTFDSEVTD